MVGLQPGDVRGFADGQRPCDIDLRSAKRVGDSRPQFAVGGCFNHARADGPVSGPTAIPNAPVGIVRWVCLAAGVLRSVCIDFVFGGTTATRDWNPNGSWRGSWRHTQARPAAVPVAVRTWVGCRIDRCHSVDTDAPQFAVRNIAGRSGDLFLDGSADR